MFAWLRDDPEALVVWVNAVEDKEGLIAADPGKFFTTSHYDGQPIVLVRLEAIDAQEAAEPDRRLVAAARAPITDPPGGRPEIDLEGHTTQSRRPRSASLGVTAPGSRPS